ALFACADADIELRDLAEDSAENDNGPDLCDQQKRLPARIRNMLKAPGHAHEAQLIKRHEGEIEADEPAPEAGLAPSFVKGEPERLHKPVVNTRKRAEHDATNDDVVKMGDKECAVGAHEIARRHRQQYAGQTAGDERDDEADCKQHRRSKHDPAAEHREQPVEDFGAGRHRENGRYNPEDIADVVTSAEPEDMMRPNHEPK